MQGESPEWRRCLLAVLSKSIWSYRSIVDSIDSAPCLLWIPFRGTGPYMGESKPEFPHQKWSRLFITQESLKDPPPPVGLQLQTSSVPGSRQGSGSCVEEEQMDPVGQQLVAPLVLATWICFLQPWDPLWESGTLRISQQPGQPSEKCLN